MAPDIGAPPQRLPARSVNRFMRRAATNKFWTRFKTMNRAETAAPTGNRLYRGFPIRDTAGCQSALHRADCSWRVSSFIFWTRIESMNCLDNFMSHIRQKLVLLGIVVHEEQGATFRSRYSCDQVNLIRIEIVFLGAVFRGLV